MKDTASDPQALKETSVDNIKDSSLQVEESLTVVKRNGFIVPFNKERITKAIEAAFKDVRNQDTQQPLADELQQAVKDVSDKVTEEIINFGSKGVSLTVEGIQDLVEVTLMRCGFHDVARGYIIYRDEHKKQRADLKNPLMVTRADGNTQVRYNPIKVASAIERSYQRIFRDELEADEIITAVNNITEKVTQLVKQAIQEHGMIPIDSVQDFIEQVLMDEGLFTVAKDFIIHRAFEEQGVSTEHISKGSSEKSVQSEQIEVQYANGERKPFKLSIIKKRLQSACKGLKDVNVQELFEDTKKQFYSGILEQEIDKACVMAARTKIELEPEYSYVAARLLLDQIYRETLSCSTQDKDLKSQHVAYFSSYIQKGIRLERLSEKLLDYDLEKLANAMDLSRDLSFTFLGLQTLYDRYFIHEQQKRLETPQIFWMRVAMGLALNEDNPTERAIEFYNVLSQFYFVSSTPTLFNSGTTHSQLSSCFLLTVYDDLAHIFKTVSDDAKLSKWAGGLGNDWTNVRATGSLIKGTNGQSQGVIPFLKVANDTAVAVNQGGKRKGAMCAYLETWHLDIEDFLELRKNTGDERRRTHDMNTANWIPDLFMKRVVENKKWTLFSPSDTPDLHDLYGKAFEKRYEEYEAMVKEGKIKLFKEVDALTLWRKMLSMLFETGHPWITFKDPSNVRSPQDHAGVVHSSNLCTEILLNTSDTETAVCNLGSINLAKHLKKDGSLDEKRIQTTVKTAIRMLDNVIDINFYPIEETRNANIKHRPVGMGLMGFQDALYMKRISYASHEAVEFADRSMEVISYYAILGSSELAKERGTYASYKGSKWDRGLLPIDTIDLLESERGAEHCAFNKDRTMDWNIVRDSVKKYGMRNSNTMAIAPTATIANIAGVTSSIEPTYKNLYVKSNLSGEFTVVNSHLVKMLKEHGLWNPDMVDDLKYYDGSVQEIENIPEEIKVLFASAFEVEPDWIIECGARRQKWIDMAQSLNLYIGEPSGKKLHNMYVTAWKKGVKTTYYLRSLSATQIEKSTTDINKRGLQPRWMKSESASNRVSVDRAPSTPKMCSMEEGCESCQ